MPIMTQCSGVDGGDGAKWRGSVYDIRSDVNKGVGGLYLKKKVLFGNIVPSFPFSFVYVAAVLNSANVPSSDGRETPVFVSHQGYDESAAGPWGHYDPNISPMPPYWGPEAWWGYYPPPNPEGQQSQKMAQPPYWDPYSAMYAYMAEMNAAYGYPSMPYPPVYSPHHFAPPRSFRYPHSGSDSDECSGYSSTDEMAYYGANFARRFPPMNPTAMQQQKNSPLSSTPTSTATPECIHKDSKDVIEADDKSEQHLKSASDSSVSDHPSSVKETDYSNSEHNSCSDEETSGSDTEVEDEQETGNSENASGGLQMIRSVSDINVYSNTTDVNSHCSDTNDEETEREEDSEEDEEEDDDQDEVIVYSEDQSCLPHQLSVIYEENEQSDAESVRQMRADKGKDSQQYSDEGDSSTATQENCDDESDIDYDTIDPASSTVTVRLPLKLKFSRSENDEEVTTLIVGDSQVKRISSDTVPSPIANFIPKDQERQQNEAHSKPGKDTDVSVTVCLSPRPYSSNKIEQSRYGIDQYSNNKLGTYANKSPSPGGLPHQMSASDLDAYETAESDSDVSVCLSLPLKSLSRKNSPTLVGVNNDNDDDEEIKVKSEESDSAFSHWEDDSSSTSVQTVKLASDSCKPQVNMDHSVEKLDKNVESTAQATNKLKYAESNPLSSVNCINEDNSDDSTSEDESSSSDSGSSRSYVSSKEVDVIKKEDIGGKGNDRSDIHLDKEISEDSSDESDDSDYEQNAAISKDKMPVSDVKGSKCSDVHLTKCDKNDSSGLQPQVSSPSSEVKPKTEKENQEKKSSGKDSLRRNSSKSQEESEEDDSGVTSDLSRPISDADTESETNQNELQLLTKCQRAATHSRLFKLLQDECGKSDDEEGMEDEDKSEQNLPDTAGMLKSRKPNLTLPLNQNSTSDPDSLSSSSGFASPASPTITDRLVKELVRSLLQRKKGKKFKKLPIAKLHAAALRILQEDMDPYDTVSSAGSEDSNSFYLSPVRTQHSNGTENVASVANNNTANSLIPPTQLPYGDNYYDYCDYYDSWANAAAYYGADPSYEYDIIPSRAFKLLQEHAQPNGFSSGVINGLWGKCPRIPSSKNIHKDYTAGGSETRTGEMCDPQPAVPSPPAPEDGHSPQQAVASAQAS